MMVMLAKAVVLTVGILILTELAKRNAYVSAVIIAFPVMTVLTIGNLYFDTGDAARASKFAYTTFWLIIASLAFFVTLYGAQQTGLAFWPSFGVAVAATVVSIIAFTLILRRFGIDLTSNL